MTTYPLEFYRRSEQKWARRAEVSGACESTQRKARARASQRFIGLGQTAFFVEGKGPLPGQSERDDILTRWPWLWAIGQSLQGEYIVEQPVPERLGALLKKLARNEM
jgi:hypothetical protein